LGDTCELGKGERKNGGKRKLKAILNEKKASVREGGMWSTRNIIMTLHSLFVLGEETPRGIREKSESVEFSGKSAFLEKEKWVNGGDTP